MARLFNGTSDYINLGHPSVLFPAAKAQSAWFYLTATPSDYVGIFGVASGANSDFMLMINPSSKMYYGYRAGAGTGGTTVSINTWHHAVLSLSSGGNVAGYLDGGVETSSSGIGALTTGTSDINIGRDSVALGRYFTGRIADCAIWNTDLTALEVTALLRGVRPTQIKPKSIIGYWPLDGLQSPEPDLSGNISNGTLTGTSKGHGPPIIMLTSTAKSVRDPIVPVIPPIPPLMGQICL